MADSPASVHRRTVLKGALWSAPVVALATAAPLAAASPLASLAFANPQMGGYSDWIYSEDGSQRFRASDPGNVRLANTGSEDFSGTVTLSLAVDTRLYEVGELTVAGTSSYPATSRTVAGQTATHTWVVPVSIAGGTEITLWAALTPLPQYPNLTIAGPLPAVDSRWTLITPSTSVWPVPHTPLVPVHPENVSLALAAPQFGETLPSVLTPDGTGQYSPASISGVAIVNSGTAALDAVVGFTLRVHYDRRVHELTGLRFIDRGEESLTPQSNGWSNDGEAVAEWELQVGIGAGETLVAVADSQFQSDVVGTVLNPVARELRWELVLPNESTYVLSTGPFERT
jgi:hypothetical protein